jgi:hypothetical protein
VGKIAVRADWLAISVSGDFAHAVGLGSVGKIAKQVLSEPTCPHGDLAHPAKLMTPA